MFEGRFPVENPATPWATWDSSPPSSRLASVAETLVRKVLKAMALLLHDVLEKGSRVEW